MAGLMTVIFYNIDFVQPQPQLAINHRKIERIWDDEKYIVFPNWSISLPYYQGCAVWKLQLIRMNSKYGGKLPPCLMKEAQKRDLLILITVIVIGFKHDFIQMLHVIWSYTLIGNVHNGVALGTQIPNTNVLTPNNK